VTRRRRIVVAVLVLLFPAALGLVAAFPEGRYLLRAGYEELRILRLRRPIEQLLADPNISSALAGQLFLVLEARRFAADSLGLDAGSTYTTFADVGRDTLLIVISASERHRLVPHTWRYPIVGVVTYQGFFDADAARAEASLLAERGLDVYLRPAGAFSTLGWFSDPLLSTALDRDPVELVATVLHELAHNTLYVPSATSFNESFANFVGYRGAERFFAARGDTNSVALAVEGWARERRADRFFEQMAERLDSLYGSGADSATLDRGRDSIFGEAREAVARPDWEINNALVIAARFYRTDLHLFDQWFEAAGRDVVQTVVQIRARVEGRRDPYAALREP
jgi:predicted aminopeptidase